MKNISRILNADKLTFHLEKRISAERALLSRVRAGGSKKKLEHRGFIKGLETALEYIKYDKGIEIEIPFESHIPIKPISDFSMGNTYYRCPVCKTDVSPDRYGCHPLDKYCHECGQALDWRDME